MESADGPQSVEIARAETARGEVVLRRRTNGTGADVLELLVNGVFVDVARGVIASNGSYRVPVSLQVGNYYLRTTLGPVSGNDTGNSPYVYVRVR